MADIIFESDDELDFKWETSNIKSIRMEGKSILKNMKIKSYIELEKNLFNYVTNKAGKHVKNEQLNKLYIDELYNLLGLVKGNNNVNKHNDDLKRNNGSFQSYIYDHLKEKRQLEHSMLKPIEVQEGIHTCFKCGSKKTYSYETQQRSGDEGMTNHIQCSNPKCKNKWTF